MKMKRFINMLLVLVIFTQLLIAFPEKIKAEEFANSYVIEFEGYLLGIDERNRADLSSESVKSEIEWVTDDVCWVETIDDVKKLQEQLDVLYVEPNYVATLLDSIPDIPDEYSYSAEEWPYEAVGAQYAADIGLSGKGIRIAVIDSGVDLQNADLQDAKIGSGYDYVEDTDLMKDDIYHGTKIAQIISGDCNGLGVTGIARLAEIVPLRCFASSGGGTVKLLSQAIYNAVDVYNCDIINMSWGLRSDSVTLRDAIEYASERGVVLVSATGNISSSNPQGTKLYPAYYEEVISVSSVDSDLVVAETALQNDGVLVCAPGVLIPFVDKNADQVTDSGTSFAAPYIAAMSAVLLELAPGLNQIGIVSLISERATDLGTNGRDAAYGFGFTEFENIIQQEWFTFQENVSDELYDCSAVGWFLSSDVYQALIAGYDAREKMEGCVFAYKNDNIVSYNYPFDQEQVKKVAVFYLDNCFTPIKDSFIRNCSI